MTREQEAQAPSESTQPTTTEAPSVNHSHHWIPVRVTTRRGEPVNEMRCQECGTKYNPFEEAEDD